MHCVYCASAPKAASSTSLSQSVNQLLLLVWGRSCNPSLVPLWNSKRLSRDFTREGQALQCVCAPQRGPQNNRIQYSAATGKGVAATRASQPATPPNDNIVADTAQQIRPDQTGLQRAAHAPAPAKAFASIFCCCHQDHDHSK